MGLKEARVQTVGILYLISRIFKHHKYIYIYIYMCVCVCVRERERERETFILWLVNVVKNMWKIEKWVCNHRPITIGSKWYGLDNDFIASDKILIVQWKKGKKELRIGTRNKVERKNREVNNEILICMSFTVLVLSL